MERKMASLENCPACGHRASVNAQQCPSCGEPFESGWAEEIARVRAQRAAVEAQRLKKRMRIKWMSVGFVIIMPVVVATTLAGIENSRIESLRETNPQEYQRIMDERAKAQAEREKIRAEERRRRNAAEIEELTAEVEKVPASNYSENIRLYKKLARLDPERELFRTKIAHYTARKEQAEKAARAQQSAAEASRKAAKQRAGFHCLSGWDGSHRAVKRGVKNALRDPGSFEHVETRITAADSSGVHTLFMTYRARNGFGGMNVSTAKARVRNAGCGATIIAYQ